MLNQSNKNNYKNNNISYNHINLIIEKFFFNVGLIQYENTHKFCKTNFILFSD